jgi:dephospho-CoA kinase
MTDEEAKQRIASQASRDDRLAAADVVVDNSGSLTDLERRLDQVWEQLTGHGPDTKR